jgi:aryl-alcohol dehydrogenase-like predicted oxidoreductase
MDKGVRLLEALQPHLEEHELTPARLALKFALSHPGVSTTIPGARTRDQVEANASASDGKPLSSEILRAIGKAQSEIGG